MGRDCNGGRSGGGACVGMVDEHACPDGTCAGRAGCPVAAVPAAALLPVPPGAREASAVCICRDRIVLFHTACALMHACKAKAAHPSPALCPLPRCATVRAAHMSAASAARELLSKVRVCGACARCASAPTCPISISAEEAHGRQNGIDRPPPRAPLPVVRAAVEHRPSLWRRTRA